MAKARAWDRTASTVDLDVSADGIQALAAITYINAWNTAGRPLFCWFGTQRGAHVLNCRSLNAG
jgi:hypothetical protein